MTISHSTLFAAQQRPRRVASRMALWLSSCLLLGVALIAFQNTFVLAILSLGILFLLQWAITRHMKVWQGMMLISLTGFIILNYGFENFIAGHIAGYPLLIGEMLMFGGLAMALWRQQARGAADLFADPAMKCIVGLWVLASLHLISDVPRFGLYALRDASGFVEAIFLLAGFLWIQQSGSLKILNKWLLFIFIANLIYSCTLPIGKMLQEHSPASGVFQPIALLGQYQHNSLYVVAGAFFCIWIARSVVNWKRWTLIVLASAQLGALLILQTRSMYIGILLIAMLIFLLGEREKLAQLGPMISAGIGAMAVLLITISALGINIQGRVMDLSGGSLREHALSIFSLNDEQSRLGQDDDRLNWIHQVWADTASDVKTLVFGQGFGKPLIDFERDGVPVRQPHNSTLGVFGRLGVLGVAAWVLFHCLILTRFVKFIRATHGVESETRSFVVWLLTFYVLALLLSMVQPAIEFSHCAIPLYFLIGVGLGIMRSATAPLATESLVEQGSPLLSSKLPIQI